MTPRLPAHPAPRAATFGRNRGSRDFDLALANKFGEQFAEKFKCANPMDSFKSRFKLLEAAQKTKKSLSPQGVAQTNVNVECLANDKDFNATVSLVDFDAWTAHLVERLEAPITAALAAAGVEASAMKTVEIVGGGSRVLAVKKSIAKLLGLDESKNNFGLSTTMNADEAVSRGAALQCAILSPLFKVKDFNIVDLVPYPIELSWAQLESDKMDVEAAEGEDKDAAAAATAGGDTCKLVILTASDDTPKSRRVTFKRTETFEVNAGYEATGLALLPEGTLPEVGKYTITVPKVEDYDAEDPPKIRVNVRHDLHGCFGVSSAQMMKTEMVDVPAAEAKAAEAKAAAPAEDKAAAPADAAAEAKEGDAASDAAVPPAVPEDKKAEDAGDPGDAPLGDAAAVAEPPTKKKKVKKIELKFEAVMAAGKMSSGEINAAVEHELQMAMEDRLIRETAERKNDLEGYIYKTRGMVEGELKDFATSEVRDTFLKALSDGEEWLYSDEVFDGKVAKSVYVQKLKELTDVGAPMEKRKWEMENRSGATSSMLAMIEEFKKQANSSDEKYAHISDEEKSKVRAECDGAEKWLYDQIALQEDKQMHEDAVLTVAAVEERSNKVDYFCRPVMNKAKPPPKPKTEEELTMEAAEAKMEELKKMAGDAAEAKATQAAPEAKDESPEIAAEQMDLD